jgi:hypothetical protein
VTVISAQRVSQNPVIAVVAGCHPLDNVVGTTARYAGCYSLPPFATNSMPLRFRTSSAIRALYFLSTLWLASAVPAHAAGVLDHLPADALGFVHIQDLGTTNARVEGFMKLFELELPTPLQFVQVSLGMADGLNIAGDALWVTLPGTSEAPIPKPLFILPVADYEKLATSIKGDPSGEICVVTMADTNVLVARKGEYAAFMNVEHRQALQDFLVADAKSLESIAPLAEWLKGNSVSGVLLPAGVETLLNLGREQLAAQEQQMSAALQDPALAATKEQLEQGMGFYRPILEALGESMHIVACSATIDENTNFRFALRALTKSSDELTPAESTPIPSQSLAGYPDEPFVIAGGGPASGHWFQVMTDKSLDLMQQMPKAYGLEEVSEPDWQKFNADYQKLVKEMQFESMSMMLGTGKPGDPIFGSFYGVVRVKDAAAYLDTFRKSIKLWNDFVAQSSSKTPWKYELQDKTVGEAKGIEMTMDFTAMMGNDPNVQMMKPMMQTMFGNNGVMRQVYLPVDGQTVIYGMADDAELQQIVDRVKQGETGLQNSAFMQTTDKLLPAAASWRIYISPPGAVEWVKNIASVFFAMMGQAPTIPEFAASPPIGIAIQMTAGKAEVDVVWPADSLKALADFIKKCEAM